ncbi:MAG: hypothetical protein K2Q22_13970, partial [Cytophagales bacterium]|nr:hypothetical protein [Cytophagales bacterium]
MSKSFGQLYFNENELTIIAKGTGGKTYSFYSNYVSSTLNEPQSEFVLTAQFKTFTSNRDTSHKLSILKIFDPLVYPAFTLRFSPVAFQYLDRDTDNRQVLTASGNLLIGNTSYPISVPIEFFFMD